MTRSALPLTTRALALGAVAGLRSAMAPALLSRAASGPGVGQRGDTVYAAFTLPNVSTLLTLAAIGELVVDKLPILPDRIAIAPLAGRAASGALVGAALFAAENASDQVGALLGALGAVAGASAGYYARVTATDSLGVPDLVVALVEDAVAVAGGFLALRA